MAEEIHILYQPAVQDTTPPVDTAAASVYTGSAAPSLINSPDNTNGSGTTAVANEGEPLEVSAPQDRGQSDALTGPYGTIHGRFDQHNVINNPDNSYPQVALAISNVQITVTDSTATITWTTNAPANGRIDYGISVRYTMVLTNDFGTESFDSTLTLSHSITIVGLGKGITYHYKVTSTNNYNQSANTGDATFTTSS